MSKIILFFCFFVISLNCFGEDTLVYKVPKSATRYFERAYQKYQVDLFKESKEYAIRSIKESKMFLKPYLLLAQIYRVERNNDKLKQVYNSIIKYDRANKYSIVHYRLGFMAFRAGKYIETKRHLLSYIQRKEIHKNDRKLRQTKRMIESCNFAIEAIKNPVSFKPERLSDNINSSHDEFLPVLTADENKIIVTVRLPIYGRNDRIVGYQEDFFVSRKVNGSWEPKKPISSRINTPGNEGAQTISADGRRLYFTACNRGDGYGRCDLYTSKKSGNSWRKPVNIGYQINTRDWESQPSISSDGLTIYFVSNREGGVGNMDIWSSDKVGELWSTPINLGVKINTEEDDMSPYIHPDNKTLYFASDGHIGMGGLDVYVTKRDSLMKWSKPKNLGFPINSFKDESGVSVNAKGDYALFATERIQERGLDIYRFKLESDCRPNPVSCITGVIMDRNTNKPIKAKVDVYDLSNSKLVMSAESDEVTGEFLITLDKNKNFALNVSKDNYLFCSQNFNTNTDSIENALVDIKLPSIDVGSRTTLNNIFFEHDSFEIKKESEIELKKMIKFLRENETVKIEIQGFTDNVGGRNYNKSLSRKRAESVYTFLIYYNVDEKRLSFVGLGDKNPVATNDTALGRKKNRRTEIVILEK